MAADAEIDALIRAVGDAGRRWLNAIEADRESPALAIRLYQEYADGVATAAELLDVTNPEVAERVRAHADEYTRMMNRAHDDG